MRPLLEEYAAGNERPTAEVRAALAVQFALTEEELAERLPSALAKTFDNRVGWAPHSRTLAHTSEPPPGAVLTRISEVRDTLASSVGESEGSPVMWARVARFEGDPGSIDARIERLRAAIESGDVPVGLAEAKFLMLVDRKSGDMLGVTLFDSEEALRKGDEAMSAGPGNAGSRSSVDFYEVPLHTL